MDLSTPVISCYGRLVLCFPSWLVKLVGCNWVVFRFKQLKPWVWSSPWEALATEFCHCENRLQPKPRIKCLQVLVSWDLWISYDLLGPLPRHQWPGSLTAGCLPADLVPPQAWRSTHRRLGGWSCLLRQRSLRLLPAGALVGDAMGLRKSIRDHRRLKGDPQIHRISVGGPWDIL